MSDAHRSTGELQVSTIFSAKTESQPPIHAKGGDRDRRLKLLYDLPLQFAQVGEIEPLYGLILDKVVELISGAERGALLIFDPAKGKLAIRASIPEHDPPISRTLIQRATREASGFIWNRHREVDPSQSIITQGIVTGMYAPLLWKGAIQGVVCVDSPHRRETFSDDDLRFLLSVAHYAAAAVANRQLTQDIQQNNTILERLLTNFSPRLRSKLLEKAKSDSLRPGGEKSDVTLLLSDIRGFTKLTDGMDASAMVEMLNEYFSAYVDAIFEHGGTIDKFIGDAILAVFGSPEPDEHQQENGVKAALAMQEATQRVNEARRIRGAVTCEIGIGLHYGEVLHGFIGAEDRLEFTVIGDTVNHLSRFCAGADSGEILVSPELAGFIGERYVTDAITIPTKHEGDLLARKLIGCRPPGS